MLTSCRGERDELRGGVSQSAYNTLASLDLPKPEQGPETINQVTEHKMSAE
ncbi:putative lipo domain protein [Escherichia coli]|nr:putative lipo domain protein [Escherichia coli]